MLAPIDAPIVSPITVGRDIHLAAVDRLLGHLGSGQGQTLLVTGEAGIGKSRLIREVQARVTSRGFGVLQGNCFETDRMLPYAPFIDMQLLDEVDAGAAAMSGPEHHKHYLFQTLTSLISRRAAQQPLMVSVEDVHWADETSLELLRLLARAATRMPLLLVLSYRSDEQSDGLRGLLTALDRDRLAVEVRLQRLQRDELESMLRAIFELGRPVRAEFVDLLYELTDGNPFFVEEVLRALAGSGDIFLRDGTWERKPVAELRVPRSVDDAVRRRTDQLTDSARRVVELAAVAGRRFDFELLRALTGFDEAQLLEPIKELIRAGLLVEESVDKLAFRHALTRQAIYGAMLGRERRALHRKVAETLDALGAGRTDEVAGDLAYHFAEAGQCERALRYARQAGERALQRRCVLSATSAGALAKHLCSSNSACGTALTAHMRKRLRARGQRWRWRRRSVIANGSAPGPAR